ncbi:MULTISPECIES: ribbon-helix-helix domain-containing protein [Rhizobium]|uniref:Aryl-sulfate sulfotransferase n=1 Tax=Rhizobium wuzhouense TaxID=1986026 RepID=A0ABX5NLY1_9HYPH|nr:MULTISPECIES: ribbon-helix-helix domain-containing protein [Rhizobium]PYB69771.1 aryl-sulfate sulfotransferase [Rhizobium wuzhouense]RKE79166.1 putative DNA-binding ribbon-helix-helix protein [Rhizobium sp. AG855]
MLAPDRTPPQAERVDLPGQTLFQIGDGDSEPKFRAIIGRGGVRRGIRLEQVYWEGLSWLLTGSRQSMGDVVEQAAQHVGDNGNLASMLRVIAFRWMWRRLAAAEASYSIESLGVLLHACPSPAIVLTREKKIQLFNEPFVTMLKQRLSLGNVAQMSSGFRFVLDTNVEDAIDNLVATRKMMTTGFIASCAGKQLTGQINLALAPVHSKQMLMGYIVRH